MFYSSQILARKGPLGVVWMAAHVDGQLKRSQIFDMSIPGTVEVLLSPEAPLALRLTGQLLLGVVRIYARKVNYLHQDCNDALTKIRVAFRAAQLELPPDNTTAQAAAITLADHALDDMALFLDPGAHLGAQGLGWPCGGGPAYSSGLGGGVLGSELHGPSGVIEVEFDILGLASQGDALLRQPSMGGRSEAGRRLSTQMLDLGTRRSGGGDLLMRRHSLLPQRASQPMPGLLDEEEMFEEADGAFDHDLDEIEVEQLRAAASVQGPDRGAGDVLAGLRGTLSGASGKMADPLTAGRAVGATPQVDGGRTAPSASLGSPEELGDRPAGLRTVVARRLPMGGTPGDGMGDGLGVSPGQSGGGEVGNGLAFEDWAPGSSSHPHTRLRPSSAAASQLGVAALEALLPDDLEGAGSQPGETPGQGRLLPDGRAGAGAEAAQGDGEAAAMDVDGEEAGEDRQAAAGAAGPTTSQPGEGQAPVQPLASGGDGSAEHHAAPGQDPDLGASQTPLPLPQQISGLQAGEPALHEEPPHQVPPGEGQAGAAEAARGRTRRTTPGAALQAPALTPMTLAPAPGPARQGAAAKAPEAGAEAPAGRPPKPKAARAASRLTTLSRHQAEVDPRGSAGTLLNARDMRALLNNRAPLLGNRRQQWRERQRLRHLQRNAASAAASVLANGMLGAAATRGSAGLGPGFQLCQPLTLLMQAASGRAPLQATLEQLAGSYLAVSAGAVAVPGSVSRGAGGTRPALLSPELLHAHGRRRGSRLAGTQGDAPAVEAGEEGLAGPLQLGLSGPGMGVDAMDEGQIEGGDDRAAGEGACTPAPGAEEEAEPWQAWGFGTGGQSAPGTVHGAGASEGRGSQEAAENLGPRLGSGLGSSEGSTVHAPAQAGGVGGPGAADAQGVAEVDVVLGTQHSQQLGAAACTQPSQAGGERAFGSPLLQQQQQQGEPLPQGQGYSSQGPSGDGQSGKENQPPASGGHWAAHAGGQGAAGQVPGDSPMRKRQRLLVSEEAERRLPAAAAQGHPAALGGSLSGAPGQGQAHQVGEASGTAAGAPMRSPVAALRQGAGAGQPGSSQGGAGSQGQAVQGSLDDELMHSDPMCSDWVPSSQCHSGGTGRQGPGAGAAPAPDSTPLRNSGESRAGAAAARSRALGTPGAVAAGQGAHGVPGAAPGPWAGGVSPAPSGRAPQGALLSPPGSAMGLGLASANKGLRRRSSWGVGALEGSGSGLLFTSGSGSDSNPERPVAGLTQGAGSVLERVARAALAKLPEGTDGFAFTQVEAGILSQEATTQLTQTRLSMEQLTQGSSRLQACRWFSELLLLQSRGHVQLQQTHAYDDVEVGLTQPGVAATSTQLVATLMSQYTQQ